MKYLYIQTANGVSLIHTNVVSVKPIYNKNDSAHSGRCLLNYVVTFDDNTAMFLPVHLKFIVSDVKIS